MVAELVVGLAFGERVRRWLHLVFLAALLGTAVYQLIQTFAGWETTQGTRVAVAAGLVLAAVYARVSSAGTFLRYAAVGAVVFLAQFLAMSPVSAIVFGGRHAASDVAPTGLGDDAPPVVLVVFDGLPTEILLDGTGHIDEELYPNLAALAGDATWYRNHTTVAQATLGAVPAILSSTAAVGRPAAGGGVQLPRQHLHAAGRQPRGPRRRADHRPVPGAGVPRAGGVARSAACSATPATCGRRRCRSTVGKSRLIPYVFDDRDERTQAWIDEQDLSPEGRPGLYVLHMLSPHPAWEYLPDGSRYTGAARGPRGLFLENWSEWGTDVALQRHVLQTQDADRMLGELLDRLRRRGRVRRRPRGGDGRPRVRVRREASSTRARPTPTTTRSCGPP